MFNSDTMKPDLIKHAQVCTAAATATAAMEQQQLSNIRPFLTLVRSAVKIHTKISSAVRQERWRRQTELRLLLVAQHGI